MRGQCYMNNSNTIQPLDYTQVPLSGINLIEASAGTGKTFAIANLYLRYILEQNFKIQEILVVTFTEAATSELKTRLLDNLKKVFHFINNYCQEEDSQFSWIKTKIINRAKALQKLSHAILEFDEAAIFTIHGFCQRMLAENIFESNLLFNIELVENDEQIIKEVVEDYWRQNYYQKPALLNKIFRAEKFSIKYFLAIAKEVARNPYIKVIPEPMDNQQTLEKNILQKITKLNQNAQKLKKEMIKNRETIFQKLFAQSSLKANLYRPKLQQQYYNEFLNTICQPFASNTKPIQKFTNQSIQKATKKNKTTPQDKFFDQCELYLQHLEIIQKEINSLLLIKKYHFIQYIKKELPIRKYEKNIQSFDDILINLQNALQHDKNDKFLNAIRKKYRAAMIDEFQDTDAIQYYIFSKIFAQNPKASMFMIGDPKQSIYAFRGADIFAYIKATKDGCKRYTLHTNYRSESNMVNAVNQLFSITKNPFLFDEILFTKVKPAQIIDTQKQLIINGEKASGLQFWNLLAPTNEAILSKTKASKIVVDTVAKEILTLLQLAKSGDAYFQNSQTRTHTPLQPTHIAILVNSHYQATTLKNELSKYNIPAVLQSSGNVFKTTEAIEVARLLRAVAEPIEHNIKAALVSKLIAIDAQTLLSWLENGENCQAYDKWLDNFMQWHNIWQKQGVMCMFRNFMQQSKMRQIILRSKNSERSLTNFLQLFELLHQQEITNQTGIHKLLTWLIETIHDDNSKEEHQLRMESDENALNIITIHKSKGLQFPIVFAPFIWSRCFDTKNQNLNDEFLFYDSKAEHPGKILELGSQQIQQHKIEYHREQLAEQMRLLYVAVTRAENRCYLSWGPISSSEKSAFMYLFKNLQSTEIDELLATSAKPYKFSKKEQAKVEQLKQTLLQFAQQTNNNVQIKEIANNTESKANQKIILNQNKILQQPAKFSAYIQHNWAVTSFSAISKNAHTHNYDNQAADRLDQTDANIEPIPITTNKYSFLNFAKGANVGTAIHEIFEEINFDNDKQWRQIASNKLRKFGLVTGESTNERETELNNKIQTIQTLLQNVLYCPLKQVAPQFTLSQLNNKQKLVEMEFFYPLQNISPKQLQQIFTQCGQANINKQFPQELGKLQFHIRKGYMHGFIDLIFTHNNKYYLLDWKTNFLGDKLTDYTPNKINQAMQESLYILQYHIYTIALHKYLQQKLGNNYNYQQNFGGVFYLFVRGMQKTQPHTGIYYDRPTQQMIKQLQQMSIYPNKLTPKL